ncbi:MAG: bifunctional diaminohydroxyphosphoribosylaminopyrimidine deaminase/5-amino-6-(5-phosphoribosylamino)uracil reductase RibD [Pseudorhodoplanes sp.]|nr:bifunctional diaminohydroxyphosphoribosylaminopyrimidine deaminase/5-amino-6-(5-phosphoribosylamino)uracil reductase RibD [Pseudorhodoplanes sp.]
MSASPHDDLRYMQLALSLGRRGLGNTWPNPAVGVVIVRDGVIVGRGVTRPGGRPHAETEALKQAGPSARGATLYTSLEPCSHHGKTPPCADAIAEAGIARVVSAIEDPNPDVAGQGHARMRGAGIAVEVGLCAEKAARAHAGHIRRVRDGRPHVTLKLAVSADGKAARAGRKPVQLTGEETRARVHRLRAMNDAILVGIGTVLADDPLLTCRLPGMEKRSPVRVVLDATLRLPLTSKLVCSAREIPVWTIFAADKDLARGAALHDIGVETMPVQRAGEGIDLKRALHALAQRGITRLLVEGGPTVAASFVAADLVDEVMLLRSPMTIGPDGIDALEGLPLAALTASPRLRSGGIETSGADAIETFARV